MGNQLSTDVGMIIKNNLKIDPDITLPLTAKHCVIVRLLLLGHDVLYLILYHDRCEISKNIGQNHADSALCQIQWFPHSVMIDYEILVPTTGDSHNVDLDEGIGVIIIECIGIYAKLIYDKSSRYGFRPIIFSRWNSSKNDINTAVRDAEIGYNILIVSGKKGEYLYNMRIGKQFETRDRSRERFIHKQLEIGTPVIIDDGGNWDIGTGHISDRAARKTK